MRLGPWPSGMNSASPDYVEPTKDAPIPLRNAVNVDVTDEGKVRRRTGRTMVVTATQAHSLHTEGGTTFMVANGAFNEVLPSLSLRPLSATFGVGRVSYASAAGDVYMTDGVKYMKYHAGNLVPAGVETPTGQPLLSSSSGGSLIAGTYAVVCTFVDYSGTESGSSLRSVITLSDGAYIQLTQIPVPVDASVAVIRVYVTPPNGTTPYHEVDVIPGAASAYIYGVSSARAALRTELMDPLPVGVSLAHTKGRMFSAVGSVVYYSEPLRYGLCNIGDDFMMFPTPVTMLIANQEGLFICADKTYFLPDVENAAPLQVVLSCGAVPHSAAAIPNSTDVAWLSTRGIVIGSVDGSVKAITDGVIAESFSGEGATIYREENGIKQLLSTASGTADTSLVASSYMIAEVIRGQ